MPGTLSYSILNDLPNARVNPAKLQAEVDALSLPTPLGHIDAAENVLTLTFSAQPSPEDEERIRVVVTSHDGAPTPESTEPLHVQLVDLQNLDGKNFFRRGFRYSASPGVENVWEEKFNANLLLCGGRYDIGPDAADGDYLEMEVVDKDGILFPAGTVLKKFVDHEYVSPNGHWELLTNDGALIPAGIYVRVRYVSVGSVGVTIRPSYNFRTYTP
jgi:hypothetical protein